MTINLTELFETQRLLDAEIERKHPRSDWENRLSQKQLALNVEVGECANDWRGFKFWSEDIESKDTLLEEFVDVLHFILSIGLELGIEQRNYEAYHTPNPLNITDTFNFFFSAINSPINMKKIATKTDWYEEVMAWYLDIAAAFDFSESEIVTAYMSKNKINHQRQEEGY